MQDGESIKERDEAKRETIGQAHLFTLRQAQKARIQSQEYNKRHVYYSNTIKAIHRYVMQRKHRQRTNADLQPNMTYTATLITVLLEQTGATHRHLHKTPKEKEVATSLCASSSPWRPQLRVPPAWSTGLVPRACTCRPPDSSDGALGELDRVLAAISVRTGWGMAGAPSH